MYMSKRQNDVQDKICKNIVEDSKVFHKNFDIVKRLDELMLRNRSNRNSSKISFPRLMSQVKRMDKSDKISRNREHSMRKNDYSSIL